jgi:hypothetical protein
MLRHTLLVVAIYLLAGTLMAQAGQFRQMQYGTGSFPNSSVVGDFNGDGNLDIAAANFFGNTVSVLLGNGYHTFKSHVDYATGNYPNGLAVGDFNGDGRLDLVVANYNVGTGDKVSVLFGNGDGTFQPHVDFGTGVGPWWVAVGDFDGDGRLDLAVANYNDSTISVLLGNGDGTFQTHVDYRTGGPLILLR